MNFPAAVLGVIIRAKQYTIKTEKDLALLYKGFLLQTKNLQQFLFILQTKNH